MNRLLVVLVSALACTGCMLAPFDGQQVASTTNPVTFEGMHLRAGGSVTIEAWDFGAGVFRPITNTTAASDGGWATSEGTLYGWSSRQTLGPAFWGPGSRNMGRHARVRAVTTSTTGAPHTMMSVNEDWGSCWNENGQSIGAFAENCRSSNSPVAVLQTRDYCPPALDNTQYTGELFYDVARRRIGATVTVTSRAPITSPSTTFSLVQAGSFLPVTWTDCTVSTPTAGRMTRTCYTSSLSVPTACAYNALLTNPLHLITRTTMGHPCHAGETQQQWAARSATCTPPPPPPPPPESRPNLTISLGAHDGITLPVSVCNVGPGTYTPVASGLLVSHQGSLQLLGTVTDVSSVVPRLAPGTCAFVGGGFIGASSGAGGGGWLASVSATACVDTANVVNEVSDVDNCATRLRD